MRICYVNPFFYPYTGGIEKCMFEIGRRLARKHEVHIVTNMLKGTAAYEVIEGMHIHRLPCLRIPIYNPPLLLDSAKKTAQKLKQIRPDVISLQGRWSFAAVLGTMRYARETKTKVVFTWHNSIGEGNILLKPISLLLDKIGVRMLEYCSKVIAVSDFVREQLIKNGASARNIVTIPNGFDKPAQNCNGFSDGNVVFVGRLVSTKGVSTLVEAVPSVLQKHPETKFYIIGRGPDALKLKTLASDLGLNGSVKFTGFLPEEVKNSMVAKAAVFVLPSIYESAGLACLEAMSMGKAVVASAVGGLPEYITNNKTGLLVPPKDPAKLAEKISLLLSNEQLRKQLGKAAMARASKFTWDDVAEQTSRTFQSVLAK